MSDLKATVTDELLERLADGESLVQICKGAGMPDRKTVQRWQDADSEFDVAVTRAREMGMFVIADQAVADALMAEDASKGRLAFDARRWYVGKLSNAFSDKQRLEHSGSVTLGQALDALENDPD